MPDSFKQSANALTLRLIATGLARLWLTTVRITILIRKDVDGHWQQTGAPLYAVSVSWHGCAIFRFYCFRILENRLITVPSAWNRSNDH